MARWAKLPLSIVSRISLIKMIVLPKFIYLFQNIPILIKKTTVLSHCKTVYYHLSGMVNLTESKEMILKDQKSLQAWRCLILFITIGHAL